MTSLPWIHAAYHEFKNRLQNFSRMITIEPQIAQVLLDNARFREGMEMVSCIYCIELFQFHMLHMDYFLLVGKRL